MAITLYGSTASPTDNLTSTATQITLTPPATMLQGDLVYVTCLQRGAATFSVGVTGGQTRNTLTRATDTNLATQSFWCTFNGYRVANPRFDFSAGVCTSAVMLVFRPTATTNIFQVDTAQSIASYSAPGSPFTVTNTGLTPVNASTVTIAFWSSDDDNTRGTLSGTGWSQTSLSAQYRNTSGSDQSMAFAYNIKTTSSATNDVSLNQSTLGGDPGVKGIICFYEVTPTITDAMCLGCYLGAGTSITKGLYRMGGNANDASGNGNTMTATNIAYAQELQGGAMNGTVTASRLEISSDLGINGSSQPFTLAVTIKPHTTIASQQVFINHVDAGQHIYSYVERFSSNLRYIRVRGGIAADISSFAQTLVGGSKYRIVMTYDGTNIRGYLNGQLKAGPTASSGNGTTGYSDQSAIGNYAGGGNAHRGYEDEAIFENRAWSAEYVMKDYTHSLGRLAIL